MINVVKRQRLIRFGFSGKLVNFRKKVRDYCPTEYIQAVRLKFGSLRASSGEGKKEEGIGSSKRKAIRTKGYHKRETSHDRIEKKIFPVVRLLILDIFLNYIASRLIFT